MKEIVLNSKRGGYKNTGVFMAQAQEQQQGQQQMAQQEQANKDKELQVKQQGNILNAASKMHATERQAGIQEAANSIGAK